VDGKGKGRGKTVQAVGGERGNEAIGGVRKSGGGSPGIG